MFLTNQFILDSIMRLSCARQAIDMRRRTEESNDKKVRDRDTRTRRRPREEMQTAEMDTESDTDSRERLK